jgi:hypothetical protein
MFFAVLAEQLIARMYDPFGWVFNVGFYLGLKRWMPWWAALIVAAMLTATIMQAVASYILSQQGLSPHGGNWAFWVLVGLIQAGLAALLSSKALWAKLKKSAGGRG